MTAPAAIVEDYNRVLEEVEPLLFIVRDSGLQRSAIEALSAFTDRTDQARFAAMLAQDEPRANHLLGFRSAARSLVRELEMYLSLKGDKPEEAWKALILAQNELGAAARAHPTFHYLVAKAQHLRDLEKAFFPPQVFMSAGMIVREQHCSLCNDLYEKCNHVAGRAYMGRFCSILIKQASLDHIAVVDEPADRLCRVTSFRVPGGTRNRMTWIVTADEEGADGSGGMRAIIAVASAEEVSDASDRPTA